MTAAAATARAAVARASGGGEGEGGGGEGEGGGGEGGGGEGGGGGGGSAGGDRTTLSRVRSRSATEASDLHSTVSPVFSETPLGPAAVLYDVLLCPQSVQSVPRAQELPRLPGPPSRQTPLPASLVQVFEHCLMVM